MATVRIKSIGKQYILSDEDYEFILRNLNKPLSVLSLNFTNNSGELWSLAVYDDADSCVTVFLKENNIKCEVDFNGFCNY